MNRVFCALVAFGMTSACTDHTDHLCDPMTEACTLETTLSTITVPAGHEDNDTCQSWTLNNPTELWISGMTQKNDGVYHHADFFFVPDDKFALPDGTWPCAANGFTEPGAAGLGGYLFAMSTLSKDEAQDLPPGDAVRIPPYSRLIAQTHVLNAGDATVTTMMKVSIRSIPPSAVQGKLAPGRLEYHDLHLDPMMRSSVSTDCMIADAYAQVSQQPFQYKLVYALTHYHTLGTYSQLAIVGGPHDGEVVMRHSGFGEGGQNQGVAFDPPIDLAALGARGLRVTCGFDNPRSTEVVWGIGEQEMCVIAFQAISDVGWAAIVPEGTGQNLGVTGDGEMQAQGPCGMRSFVWDFNKAGGPPR